MGRLDLGTPRKAHAASAARRGDESQAPPTSLVQRQPDAQSVSHLDVAHLQGGSLSTHTAPSRQPRPPRPGDVPPSNTIRGTRNGQTAFAFHSSHASHPNPRPRLCCMWGEHLYLTADTSPFPNLHGPSVSSWAPSGLTCILLTPGRKAKSASDRNAISKPQ